MTFWRVLRKRRLLEKSMSRWGNSRFCAATIFDTYDTTGVAMDQAFVAGGPAMGNPQWPAQCIC